MHIKEAKFYTAYLQELFHFYSDTLGMNCTLSGNELLIRTKRSLLRFEKSKNNTEPYYHFAFNIPSDKIEEAYSWLADRVQLLWIDDYKSFIADFSNWQAKSLYFIDPAGNVVEFISRLSQADLSDDPFSSDLIRNISEVGLVFPEKKFNEQVNFLLSKGDLTYFSKQPPLDGFRAIGDDEGLFICVPENRSWYPLKNKPAFLFPHDIKVKTPNTEFLLCY